MDLRNIDQNNFEKLKNSSVNSAILALGSMEQHGNHLPFSTDTIIAQHISEIVAEKTNSFLLPPLYYGVSFEHFPLFNISIKHNIIVEYISDICTSLIKNGIQKLYVINGHHGNAGLLQYIGQNISSNHIPVNDFFYCINYWQLMEQYFDHAGKVETSLMLAICPELVKMDLARSGFNVEPKDNSLQRIGINMSINNPGGFIKFTKNGIWGNPLESSMSEGERILSGVIEKIIFLIANKNFM
ncbi:MAG: creatininase family protein [Thermoproteota archaeon]|nr:creatininase family protein [Thermoproteota archaeon]